MAQGQDGVTEITSLNVEDLDIEELERRLEMASAELGAAAWICGADGNSGGGGCEVVCYCNTVDGCPALYNCPVDVCPADVIAIAQ